MKIAPKTSDLEVSTMRLNNKEEIPDSVDSMVVITLPCGHSRTTDELSQRIKYQMDRNKIATCPCWNEEIADEIIICENEEDNVYSLLKPSEFERYKHL